jgi:hypothetical protein
LVSPDGGDLRKRARDDLAGLAAVILAVTVGGGLAAALVILALRAPANGAAEDAITALCGAAIGALGTYLGLRGGQRRGP